jgi:hypothetical protein
MMRFGEFCNDATDTRLKTPSSSDDVSVNRENLQAGFTELQNNAIVSRTGFKQDALITCSASVSASHFSEMRQSARNLAAHRHTNRPSLLHM